MPNYVLKQPGEVVQGFTINSIIAYSSNEPVYSVTCGGCGTSGVAIKHDEFRRGTARCSSDTHFSTVRAMLPPSSPPPVNEPEPVKVDDYVQNLRAAHEAAESESKQQAAQQWNQYIRYGLVHDWNLKKMIDIYDWVKILPEQREEILEKQRAGHYDKKKDKSA